MIDAIYTALLNSSTYLKKHPQLLATCILIIIIPVAFLFSGQQFLSAAKSNQEKLELERIGMLHDVFSSFLVATNFDSGLMSQEIENISSQNDDLVIFDVLHEQAGALTVVGSNRSDTVGSKVEDLTTFRRSLAEPSGSIIFPKAISGVRYWDTYRAIETNTGERYYLYTRSSLQDIDSQLAKRIIEAYYWLFGILAVVLILLLRHVRLIDYAYLYRETKKANEMKDLFTNMIAHELRAPLTAMQGYASLVREKSSDKDVQEYALKIERSSDRLIVIVSDLLDVARIHSGKLAIKNERTDVSKIIIEVVETMQSSALEKNIRLRTESADTQIFANIDAKRLFQAITNLVSNAIKYTKSGEIIVSFEERKDRVEIRVKDTGMGISAENQKSLFAPFFRIENTDTEGTVGTGLGMWITKQLIDLMKGSIGVESIKGVGTHIVITLPK